MQPAVIAPPPSVEVASNRVGELNIGHSAVIAPAPALPVAEQRAVPGGRSLAAQVVPPPPSVGTGAAGASFGAPGRVIALSLHPTVGAPPDPPAGNRRGSFAATPEGHRGASGAPGASAGSGKENATGSGKKNSGTLPSGLYVGKTSSVTSPVAGDPAPKNSNTINPNLIANVRPLRLQARTQPEDGKLSD